jgi:alkanesulfonate monooxygenase SsuD/methylene tetrahydromethanopterin reductase-like flavin-dependent oxidoreductase (luciferase family)
VGRVADGWLPSLGYVSGGLAGLAGMNQRIDDAAASAGRDPARIRRLLNVGGQFTSTPRGFLSGPPEQWAEQLAALALEDGISAFILAADDAATVELFAAEVAPATRELVTAERSRTTASA